MRAVLLALAILGCAPAAAPHTDTTPSIGAVAPASTLTTAANTTVALADTWKAHDKTIVVFYRGFW